MYTYVYVIYVMYVVQCKIVINVCYIMTKLTVIVT